MSTLSNIVNHRAPVTVWVRGHRTDDPPRQARRFSCLKDFVAWYRPDSHGPVSVVSRYLFTDVLLDRTSLPPIKE